jgi:hypothetical protein
MDESTIAIWFLTAVLIELFGSFALYLYLRTAGVQTSFFFRERQVIWNIYITLCEEAKIDQVFEWFC